MAAIDGHWNRIEEIVTRARRSTGHVTLASVDADGVPKFCCALTIWAHDMTPALDTSRGRFEPGSAARSVSE